MANTPIHMSKLRQVFKLHDQGVPKLQISTATGLSRNTVKKHLTIFTELKTPWEALSVLSDKELHEFFRLEPVIELETRLKVLYEFFKENDKKLSQRGMTLGRLFTHYTRDHEDGYHTTAFYKHYRLWKRRASPSMRMVHIAGDKMYVDYTGVRLRAVDVSTGKIEDVEVFVAILGASQLTYVEAVASQKVEDFIGCCERALHFFGGAPRAVVPDNLKSAVIKSNRYEPKINKNFEGFADHYGMTVLPARAYKPKDKALVEGAVKIAYNKIFAALPHEQVLPLTELNAAIRELLDAHNNAQLQGRDYSRMDVFLETEQPALQPLPALRYEMRSAIQATAMKNGHICLSADKHYYSVPYAYIGKKMRVLYSVSFVEIFYKYDLVAAHARSRRQHGYTTDETHMASQHKALTEWSPEFFLKKARLIGPDVESYIENVLMKKTHPEQTYKTCNGILSFAHRIGHERLSKACKRAESFQTYTYRFIESILKKGLEVDEPESEQLTMPKHKNIRGKEYYSATDADGVDDESTDDDDVNDDESPTIGDDDE